MNREEYRGSLWKTESQKGTSYYKGKLKIGDREYQVSLFKNNKTNEKQPDLNIIVRDSVISQGNQKQGKNTIEIEPTKRIDSVEELKKETDEQVYVDFGMSIDDFVDEDLPF